MSLAIVSLKLRSWNMAITLIFLLKNVSSFCICKSYSHVFSKNTCELDIIFTRTANIWPLTSSLSWRCFRRWCKKCNKKYKWSYPWKATIMMHSFSKVTEKRDEDQTIIRHKGTVAIADIPNKNELQQRNRLGTVSRNNYEGGRGGWMGRGFLCRSKLQIYVRST